jgi:hypothetical protein
LPIAAAMASFCAVKRLAPIALAGLFLASAGAGLARPTPTPTPTEEPEGTISGIAIARTAGGWLGLELREHTFRLTFYDAKKMPVAADVTSAVLRWPVRYQPNDERTLLLPTDEPSVLASAFWVKGPLAFKLHITLLVEGKTDTPPESYVIDFHG